MITWDGIYRCPFCSWNESLTRMPNPVIDISPEKRYIIHLFLEHDFPLPFENKK